MSRPPLRVLLCVQKRQRRGAEVFAHQLAGALRDAGWPVRTAYLYAPPPHGTLPLAADDQELGGREDHPLERVPGFHPGLLRRLRTSLRDFAPDVVQLNGSRSVKYGALLRWLDPAGTWALVYRNIGDPRHWMTGRGKRFLYGRLVMRALDGVTAVSSATLAALEELYELPPERAVLHRFVASAPTPSRPLDEIRRELGAGPGDRVLLYVGSLSREKRADRFLEVLQRLRGPGHPVRGWLAGDGPERRRLEELADRLGLDGAVRFLGARSDVDDLYAAADLLLVTSDTEGLPGVILEAGAHGLPAVSTAAGGVAECIVDGVSGRIVAPDAEAVAAAAAHLLADDELRRETGAAARDLVGERFSREAAVERYGRFLHRVVARRRGRVPAEGTDD